MTREKYSPAPWTVLNHPDFVDRYVLRAEFSKDIQERSEQCIANAQLMEQAPNLLAACRIALRRIEELNSDAKDPVVAILQIAIHAASAPP